MRPRKQSWIDLQQLSFTGPATVPPAAARLTLRALVFSDQLGNVVIVDPHRDKPLGARALDRRQPSLYVAASEQEVLAALEEVTWVAEHWLKMGRREVAAIERARDARRRLDGMTPPSRLPRVA